MPGPHRLVLTWLSTSTVLFLLILGGCQPDDQGPEVVVPEVPAWFPALPLPDDGELLLAKVELGRKLFYDPILSRNGTLSCSTCHQQSLGFTDGLALSEGIDGALNLRNAPTLANVAWQPYLFMDGGVATLEIQVEGPLFAHNEFDHSFASASLRLNADLGYRAQFEAVFSKTADAYGITRSIAAFERTMVSGYSRFDQFYYQQNQNALTPAEQRGWELFSSNEAKCLSCHTLPLFTDFSFANIGLYLNYVDSGRARVSFDGADNGKFKVPTLRNVSNTAPYMHNGSLASLTDVVEHFSSGVQPHANLDPNVSNLNLTSAQKSDLVAFLGALTDVEFLSRGGLGVPVE